MTHVYGLQGKAYATRAVSDSTLQPKAPMNHRNAKLLETCKSNEKRSTCANSTIRHPIITFGGIALGPFARPTTDHKTRAAAGNKQTQNVASAKKIIITRS